MSTPSIPSDDRRSRRLPGLLLLVTAAAYAAVAGAGFVWDDVLLFVENQRFHTASLWAMLSGELWSGVDSVAAPGYYRPLVQASFWIDRVLFGFAPAGWHLHSLAWHLLAVALLYRLLVRLLGQGNGLELPALCGAAFFALHPVQSEAVAWIAARNDTMAAALMLATVLLALRTDVPLRASRIAAATGCYMLALWAKETTVFTPLVLALLEAGRGRTRGPADRARYAALLLGLAAVVAIRFMLEIPGSVFLHLADWRVVPARLPTIAGTYGWLLVDPWPLLVTRHLSYLPTGMTPSRIAGMAVWVLMAIAALACRDRHRRVVAITGLAGAAVMFAPSVVAIVYARLLGERYLYLPMAWLAVWLAAVLPPRGPRAVPAISGGLVLFAVAALFILHIRLPDWSSNMTLFEADVRRAPGCYSRGLYAQLLMSVHRPGDALEVVRPEVPANPQCPDAFRTAVAAATVTGRYDDAVRWAGIGMQGPLADSPSFAAEYAWALALGGRWDEAERIASSTVSKLPAGHGAVVLAAALWRKGAVSDWQRLAAQWQDRRLMETWVARLLYRAGEREALAKLEAAGVDRDAPVGPLQSGD